MYVCMNVCMYVCMYVCIYVCTSMPIPLSTWISLVLTFLTFAISSCIVHTSVCTVLLISYCVYPSTPLPPPPLSSPPPHSSLPLLPTPLSLSSPCSSTRWLVWEHTSLVRCTSRCPRGRDQLKGGHLLATSSLTAGRLCSGTTQLAAVCVCVCAGMCACACVLCVYYVCVCVWLNVCVCVCVCVQCFTHVCVCVCVCTCVYYVCEWVFECVCCLCVYSTVQCFTHTSYIHTYVCINLHM